MSLPLQTIWNLAKWKAGGEAYYVTCKPPDLPELSEDDLWMFDRSVHPRVPFLRGVLPNTLGRQSPLPKLPATEFDWAMGILQGILTVATFEVESVSRCPMTGECIYVSTDAECMPESCLFETRELANVECKRIHDLFRRWANGGPNF